MMIPGDLSQRERELLEIAFRAKEANKILLRSKPNVTAIDIGFRHEVDTGAREPVIKVFVSQKVRRERLAAEDVIPKSVSLGDDVVPVDVEIAAIDRPQ